MYIDIPAVCKQQQHYHDSSNCLKRFPISCWSKSQDVQIVPVNIQSVSVDHLNSELNKREHNLSRKERSLKCTLNVPVLETNFSQLTLLHDRLMQYTWFALDPNIIVMRASKVVSSVSTVPPQTILCSSTVDKVYEHRSSTFSILLRREVG